MSDVECEGVYVDLCGECHHEREQVQKFKKSKVKRPGEEVRRDQERSEESP